MDSSQCVLWTQLYLHLLHPSVGDEWYLGYQVGHEASGLYSHFIHIQAASDSAVLLGSDTP